MTTLIGCLFLMPARQRVAWFALFALLSLSVATTSAGAEQTSALWGANGEAWSPTSRLPGFAFAGYGCGRRALPDYPVRTNVKEHGAKGDGVTDDTASFIAALKAVGEQGAVLVPAGRYVITDVIELKRSRVVLRGEGPDKSILVFPEPLSEINPKENKWSKKKAVYSFNGAFFMMEGSDNGQKIAQVVAPAKRGDTVLTLSGKTALKVGDWIRLVMQDSEDRSLIRHIHGDVLRGGSGPDKKLVDWAAQVTDVNGTRITLDRPLRLDVRAKWSPEVMTLEPTLVESGIESLGFEFPGVKKLAHLKEAGFNAIQLVGAVNCWTRDVTVVDADLGIDLSGCRFCTVDGFTARAVKRTGLTGHHALTAKRLTQDSLFIRFRCDTTYVHDLSVAGHACGNVFTKGSGVSINCDHHRAGPYENLFTDFDAGDATRLFASSGSANMGPHSGARSTFWGIRGKGKFPGIPPAKEWPLINLVGFGNFEPTQETAGSWAEPCGGMVTPANLWEAQVKFLSRK